MHSEGSANGRPSRRRFSWFSS